MTVLILEFCFMHIFIAVEDFEIIELDRKRGSWILRPAKADSPRTEARKRWKDAIEQQIILNRMEKQNNLFMSEWVKSGYIVCVDCRTDVQCS